MKKIITLTLFLLISVIQFTITSCSSCGLFEKFDSKFHARNISINNYKGNKYIEDSSAFSFNEINFKVYFSGPTYSKKRQTNHGNNLLYACSPPELESFEKIRNINITCKQDYDSTHPTGTSLNDIIEIRSYRFGQSTIEEYLLNQPNIENTEFRLIKAPSTSQNYEFEIHYTFDGLYTNQLSSVTKPIYIKQQ